MVLTHGPYYYLSSEYYFRHSLDASIPYYFTMWLISPMWKVTHTTLG